MEELIYPLLAMLMFYMLMRKQRPRVLGIIAMPGDNLTTDVAKKVCPSCAGEILFPVGVDDGMEILECEDCGTRLNDNGVV